MVTGNDVLLALVGCDEFNEFGGTGRRDCDDDGGYAICSVGSGELRVRLALGI